MGLSLASATPPQVVSLILSDVVGDPVEVIASGPTVASIHSVQDCTSSIAMAFALPCHVL